MRRFTVIRGGEKYKVQLYENNMLEYGEGIGYRIYISIECKEHPGVLIQIILGVKESWDKLNLSTKKRYLDDLIMNYDVRHKLHKCPGKSISGSTSPKGFNIKQITHKQI